MPFPNRALSRLVPALALLSTSALAQPPAAPVADPSEAEARRHFDLGVGLFEEEAWDPALAEFARSRELHPTRAATKDAAICLRKLHRFDEALDLLESLLEDFPSLPPEDRKLAREQIDELASLVGTVSISGAPEGARVVVDDRERGRTPLPPFRAGAGTHTVQISKGGFVPFERRITVAGGQAQSLDVTLVSIGATPEGAPTGVTTPVATSRDTSHQAGEGAARAPSEDWFIDLDGALALSPSFGTGLSCSAPCASHPPIGAALLGHGGIEFRSGLGLGLQAGYLTERSTLESRDVALHPVNLDDNHGTTEDTLRLSGVLVGASALFHTHGKVPILVRLGAGALLGNLRDERKGGASTNERPNPAATPGEAGTFPAMGYSFDTSESPAARFVYVAPELRAGVHLGEHVELSFGVRALVLFAITRPAWADTNPVYPGASYHVGNVTFGSDTLTGPIVLVVSPGLGVRYEF